LGIIIERYTRTASTNITLLQLIKTPTIESHIMEHLQYTPNVSSSALLPPLSLPSLPPLSEASLPPLSEASLPSPSDASLPSLLEPSLQSLLESTSLSKSSTQNKLFFEGKSNISIFFGGNAHSKFLIKFLEKINAKKVMYKSGSNNIVSNIPKYDIIKEMQQILISAENVSQSGGIKLLNNNNAKLYNYAY
jgi:hypothetical protein